MDSMESPWIIVLFIEPKKVLRLLCVCVFLDELIASARDSQRQVNAVEVAQHVCPLSFSTGGDGHHLQLGPGLQGVRRPSEY